LVIFLNNNQIQTLISILDLKHAKLRNKIKIKSRLRNKQKTTVSNSIYTEIKDQTEKRLRHTHTHINSNNLAINSIKKSISKVKFKLPSDNISHNYNKNLFTNSINDRQIDYETSETSRRSYSLRTVSETSTKNTSYKNMLKENFKNNSSSRYLGRRKSESCAVIATSQSLKRFMDDEDDAINYLNGQPLKKHDSTHSEQLLNNLSVTRPLRGAVASKAKENRLAEYTKKNITDTQDKVEVDRRVEARINELKASKTPYKRADIIKEVKDSFRKEKWPVPSPKPTQSEKGCSAEKNQSTGFAQSTPKMLHKPVSETKQQNYRDGKEETEDDSESSSSDEESESSANTSASQQDMEVASETYIGITDDDITMLKTLASSQRNLGDDWTEIMQKLETKKLDDLNDEQSDMLKEKIIELRLSAQKANLLELVSKLTLEQMAETAAELGKVGLNDLADLCDKKLYCEMTIEQLQLLLSTFNGSKLGPEYVETRNKLLDKLNNLSLLDKELLTSLLDNTTMRLNHGKELQQLHENNLTSVENEALTRLVNLTTKLPDLHKTNEDNKKKILLQIKKLNNEDIQELQDLVVNGAQIPESVKITIELVAKKQTQGCTFKQLEEVFNLHLSGPRGPTQESLLSWIKSLKFNAIRRLEAELNKNVDDGHNRTAANKLFRREFNSLTTTEIFNLKIMHESIGDSESINSTYPKPNETNLERMERTYNIERYTLSIHTPGLAEDKYAGNVGARIREIKRITNANRIISSSINGDLKSKKVYTKIDTDNKEDFVKILNCDWPDNSFDCKSKPIVLREGISFKVEIMDVDKDIKLELHKESIAELKKQGLRNLRRATRYDHLTMEEHTLNKIEFNVTDFEKLRSVILDGVSIECTQRNHDVQPHFERVRNCKNCQEYGHGAKHCKNPPRCGKCPSTTHNVTTCTNKRGI